MSTRISALFVASAVVCVNGVAMDPIARGVAAPVVNSPPAISGPTFSKKLSTPDPVPMPGQMRALELMSSGALFRYTPGYTSEVALAEEAWCEHTGFKYAVGFNSCGSALFIALKCLGVEAGDNVLANAFSFTAVPSAIHHASATPVYVESTDGFVMDMEDLEAKITPETKYLMLTHMRGKVADMDKAYELAAKYDLQVVEDCAHALGIKWQGEQLGRRAKVACFSTQSAKLINSGEGGFLCTDDEEIAAKAICYAGSYENLIEQHIVAPPREVFDRVKKQTPNYSLRMSDLTACCIRPQFDRLEGDIGIYNARYDRLVAQLQADELGAQHFHIPPIDSRVRPVCDSLQINVRQMNKESLNKFLGASKKRGMPVGLFGSADNARNFRNWKYAPIATGCDSTEKMIGAAIDVRLPLVFDDEDIDQMGAVLLAALADAVADDA